jgi:hypothetical protein
MSIQLITDGINGRDERVVLWRTGEYTYELEIGTGIYKKNLKFYETEFGDAIGYFDAVLNNYSEI